MKLGYKMRRLTEPGSGASDEVVAGIEQLRSRTGGAGQVARLQARVQERIAVGSVAPSADATRLPSHHARLATKGLLLLGVGIAIWLSWSRLGPESSIQQSRAVRPVNLSPQVVAVPVVDSQAARRPSIPEGTKRKATDDSPSVRAGASQPLKVVPRRHSPAAPTAPDPEAELALLQRAQRALEHDPREAVQYTRQHARDYPEGIFVEEREVLRMEADMKLGRIPAVHRRAREFARRFPNSAHMQRVDQFLRDRVAP